MLQERAKCGTLAGLLAITDGFLAFVNALGRPLTKAERSSLRWIIEAWEAESISDECAKFSDAKLRHLAEKMAAIREAFYPDPVHQSGRVKCDRSNITPKISNGNHKSVIKAMLGVTVRRMNDQEAEDRYALLRRLVWSVQYLVNELAIYQGSRSNANLGKAGGKFHKLCVFIIKELDPANSTTVGVPQVPSESPSEVPAKEAYEATLAEDEDPIEPPIEEDDDEDDDDSSTSGEP